MARFAYFFSQFPTLSTTFIQRELRAAETAGHETLLIATTPPKKGTYHPCDADLHQRTIYLRRATPLAYLAAHLFLLITSPVKYWRSITCALTLRDNFKRQRLVNLIHVGAAGLLCRILRKNGFSHVHVHFAFGAASIALFARELSGISYSISIHGSDVLLPRPLTFDKIRRAKHIISNCDFHIHNLIERYPELSGQNFSVVRLGCTIDEPIWSKAPPSEPSHPLRILTIGRLLPVKAQDILIHACARLADQGIDFRCRIVGEGPLKSELAHLIDRLGLSDRVTLYGKCFEPEIIENIIWSHVVVLSSLSEGTPMVLIEGMTKGRPCVAPAITAIPELIVEGVNGLLFEKGNPDNFAAKIAMLDGDVTLRRTMGIAGRIRAEQLFNGQQNTKQLFSILDKLNHQ